jgi:hypothetical protein
MAEAVQGRGLSETVPGFPVDGQRLLAAGNCLREVPQVRAVPPDGVQGSCDPDAVAEGSI